MKLNFALALILLGVSICAAQPRNKNIKTVAASPLVLKKQILVDDLDGQAKNLALPAVRIFVRTKIAEWLWKNGADETERAESLAVKAVEELFDKKNEIPDARFLTRNVFVLLDKNAAETAIKLRAKYNVKDENLFGAFPPLDEKGGDRALADKIKSALAAEKDLAVVSMNIARLQKQNSPEAASLLTEIISLHETGRNTFSSQSLLWIARVIIDPAVPKDLKIRFYRIALHAARNALQLSVPYEIQFTDSTLYEILPDMTANAPDLAAEGNALKIALLAKTSQKMRDYQESDQRIKESSNKLDALISEAEKTNDAGLKSNFLRNASDAALKEGKFQLAADLIGKTVQNKTDVGNLPMETLVSNHDLQLNQITYAALKKDDVESAVYATKRIVGEMKKAESLRQTAHYFHGKKDAVAALDNYDEALKLAAAGSDKSKYAVLFSLIFTAAEIDRNRVSEVVSISAKAIEKLRALNAEDKPGTEGFKDYSATITAVNLRLHLALSNLMRKHKSAATDFANRINRKEVKIIADLVMAIDAFETEQKTSESR